MPPKEIKIAVKGIPSITTSQRQKKLSSRTILEFVALIYLYSIVVTGNVREHRTSELYDLFYNRIPQKKDFFISNELLITSYEFCLKILNYFLNKP